MRGSRCAVLLTCVAAPCFGQGVTQVREQPGHFVGAIGCKSSSCHGGAGEKRSQFVTWSKQDLHSRANVILFNARSTRIAEAAGLGDAPSSARCTVCHSPFQAVEKRRLGAGVQPNEGVSCETCHGAAGGWLRGHTRPDWTPANRVAAGMRDLRNLYDRANACVACHQNVDRDLLKAGHPTLFFELDSQSVTQPKHWRDPDNWTGLRSWLTGQAVALREAAWKARNDPDPAPDMQETSMALAWLLARVTLSDPDLPKISEPENSDLAPLQKQADELARRAARWSPDAEVALAMLRALAESGGDFPKGDAGFYRARRIVLALHSLMTALNVNRPAPLPVSAEMAVLREDVRLPGSFEPGRFHQHLAALRAKL